MIHLDKQVVERQFVIHHVDMKEILTELASIKVMLQKLIKEEKIMNTEMQALADKVTAITTVDQSAVALIQGLADQIHQLVANATDLAQMKADAVALAGNLDAANASLAAAVAANTPPATEPAA